MQVKDMFSENRVVFELKSKTKDEVLNELIELLWKDGKVIDKDIFKKAVLKREE